VQPLFKLAGWTLLATRRKDVRRPDVQKMFRMAGERAALTCDICGSPGKFRSEARRRALRLASRFRGVGLANGSAV